MKPKKGIEHTEERLMKFLERAKKHKKFFVFAISDDGDTTEGFSESENMDYSKIARAFSKLPTPVLEMAMAMNLVGDAVCSKKSKKTKK